MGTHDTVYCVLASLRSWLSSAFPSPCESFSRDAESFPLPHWIWARPGIAVDNVMWRESHWEPLSWGVKKAWQLPLSCPWSPEPHVRSPGYPGGKRGQHGEVLGDEKAPAGEAPWGTTGTPDVSEEPCWTMWGIPPRPHTLWSRG